MKKMNHNDSVSSVRDDYPHYVAILDGTKQLLDSEIALVKDAKKENRCEREVALTHSSIDDKMTLQVEGHFTDVKKFKFKVFDKDYMPEPCFRFDSFGNSHVNFSDEPLQTRRVDTPHFHKFDAEGIQKAYRTKFIEQNEEALLKDRNKAFLHFMEEGHIECDRKVHVLNDDLFQPSDALVDPLKDIGFDE